MKCPNCEALLVMSERKGIEIDYCPQCRGVWLDKGELDKIIERSTEVQEMPDRDKMDDKWSKDRRPEDLHGYRPDYKHDPRYPYKKKKGGFLGDLFDFD